MISQRNFYGKCNNLRHERWFQITGEDYNNVWAPELVFRRIVSTINIPPYGKGNGKHDFWVQMINGTALMTFYEYLKVTVSCHFVFDTFPVDVNTCDLDFGFHQLTYNVAARINPIKFLNLDASASVMDDEKRVNGDHLPFLFTISAKDEFQFHNYEFMAPYSGITIKLKRNSINSLMGTFYLPTATFSILSMISFYISPDMVNMYCDSYE